MHPGAVAEKAEELEAESLAGMFLPGADVEGGREGSDLETVGVEDPEGKEVELFGQARKVFAIEINDLVDDGLGIGLSRVIGVHKSPWELLAAGLLAS